MTAPRNLTRLFALCSAVSAVTTAFGSLRAGRRDGDRVMLVHGLGNLLIAAITAALFIQQRRKDDHP